MHVSVAAETLFKIGPLPITNSLLTTFLVSLFLIILALVTYRKISNLPSRLQSFMEIMIGALLNLTEDVAGKSFGRKIFPLLATFFIFIILANWSGLIPGVGSVGIYEEKETAQIMQDSQTVLASGDNSTSEDSQKETETESHQVFVPLFRGPTADLNTTIALALISVMMIQYYGLKNLGLKYLKKFFNFTNPINAFIGILELISEFSRIISFAFRLFGNIFAGEVLLTVVAYLIPFIAPLPFIGLEIFVGFIQALVFMMLSLVFISMATLNEH